MKLADLFESPKGEKYQSSPSQISRFLRHHGNDESTRFHILHHNPRQKTSLKPLIIVVHPGDMIEHHMGWGSSEAAKRVLDYSRENQVGTAKELQQWRQTYDADVVILHRPRCEQFITGQADRSLTDQIKLIWKNGQTVLFGDDLDRAIQWMANHLNLEQRPHIFLAGAYRTPQSGCLTRIGQAIVQMVGSDKVIISKYSPPGNQPGRRWTPHLRESRLYTRTLRPGKRLYHGTNADWDGHHPHGPFWVSDIPEVAENFQNWHGEDGRSRIFVYRLIRPIRLLLVPDAETFDEIEERTGYRTGGGSHEMAEAVLSMGYDGWITPDNYSPGADIMIGDPSCLQLIRTIEGDGE